MELNLLLPLLVVVNQASVSLRYSVSLTFFKYGPFPASFGIYFSFFLEHCQLEIDYFTRVNDYRKQERRRKSMYCSITHC